MPDQTPSRRTLDRSFFKAVRFIWTAARNDAIRRSLRPLGFTEAEHEYAWNLVQTITRYKKEEEARNELNAEVVAAMQQLDDMDAPVIQRVGAALNHRHPEVAKFVMHDLKAGTGPDAIISMGTLVQRMRALQSSGERTETRAADAAALATLAGRGFDESWLEKVEGLLEIAQAYRKLPDEREDDPVRAEALLDLHGWYRDWAETARAGVSNRRHRIALGVSSRRSSQTTEDEDDESDLLDVVVDDELLTPTP